MQTQCFIQSGKLLRLEMPAALMRKPRFVYGADLLRHGFAVFGKARLFGGERDFEGEDAAHVGAKGDSGNEAAGSVGDIVADDDDRPSFLYFRATRRIKLREINVTTLHERAHPWRRRQIRR